MERTYKQQKAFNAKKKKALEKILDNYWLERLSGLLIDKKSSDKLAVLRVTNAHLRYRDKYIGMSNPFLNEHGMPERIPYVTLEADISLDIDIDLDLDNWQMVKRD